LGRIGDAEKWPPCDDALGLSKFVAFLGKEPILRMTGEFQDFKSEIVARLAEHLIPFVQQAAAAETLVQDFERGLVLPITSRRRESDGHLSASARGWRPR
jgi:hypothetical protein